MFHHLSNPYVNHFYKINSLSVCTNEELLAGALASLDQYDFWGLYENLQVFISDLAEFLDLPPTIQLPFVNVTKQRLSVESLTPTFLKNIQSLVSLDIEFYNTLQSCYHSSRLRWLSHEATLTTWKPYERVLCRTFVSPQFSLLNFFFDVDVDVDGDCDHITSGAIIKFVLEFSLATAINELEIGIHIYDEAGRLAYGTNTSMLGNRLLHLSPFKYIVSFALEANFPEGSFTAGFAFAEIADGKLRELAWYDKLATFSVIKNQSQPFVGYSSLLCETFLARVDG